MTGGRWWHRRTVIRALTVAPLGVLASCGGLTGTSEAPVVAPPPAPAEVGPIVIVRRGDILDTIIVNARLSATKEASLFFRQTGRLKNLTVSSSDKVKAGQVMAELEVGALGTEVALAEIAMKKAQVRLEQARSQGADRFAIQLVQADYDTARLIYVNLRDRLEAARLVAPFDGIVTETAGRPGETVGAFAQVIGLADPSEFQVTADLANQGDASRLTIGQPATLLLDKLPTTKLPLQVVQLPTLAATLLNGTPTPVDVARRFKLNPTQPLPKDLELGMLGRVTVVLREKTRVLLLKGSAVRSAGPRRFVQVVQGGRKRDVDIEVGIITATEAEIVVGLAEGDRVLDGVAGGPSPAPATKGG